MQERNRLLPLARSQQVPRLVYRLPLRQSEARAHEQDDEFRFHRTALNFSDRVIPAPSVT
jgi:hypothetical protein